jgi:hypothetical protein
MRCINDLLGVAGQIANHEIQLRNAEFEGHEQ